MLAGGVQEPPPETPPTTEAPDDETPTEDEAPLHWSELERQRFTPDPPAHVPRHWWLAVGSAGVPVVAWHELGEPASTASVARWDDGSWEPLGERVHEDLSVRTPRLGSTADGAPAVAVETWQEEPYWASTVEVRVWEGGEWRQLGASTYSDPNDDAFARARMANRGPHGSSTSAGTRPAASMEGSTTTRPTSRGSRLATLEAQTERKNDQT